MYSLGGASYLGNVFVLNIDSELNFVLMNNKLTLKDLTTVILHVISKLF